MATRDIALQMILQSIPVVSNRHENISMASMLERWGEERRVLMREDHRIIVSGTAWDAIRVQNQTVVPDRISKVTETKRRNKVEQCKTVEEVIQACPDTECTVCTDPLSVEADIGILVGCCHLTCLSCTQKLYSSLKSTSE